MIANDHQKGLVHNKLTHGLGNGRANTHHHSGCRRRFRSLLIHLEHGFMKHSIDLKLFLAAIHGAELRLSGFESPDHAHFFQGAVEAEPGIDLESGKTHIHFLNRSGGRDKVVEARGRERHLEFRKAVALFGQDENNRTVTALAWHGEACGVAVFPEHKAPLLAHHRKRLGGTGGQFERFFRGFGLGERLVPLALEVDRVGQNQSGERGEHP